MEFEADGARWPEPRGDAAGAPPLERGDAPSPRFDSSRALRLLRELGSNVTEDLVVLMPNLLSFLKHDDPAVVNQSIASGTNLFAAVLEEMTLQINKCGRVDAWLEEMWAWMKQFKDAVHNLIHESVPVATKLFAVKFIETWILCSAPQSKSDRMQPTEGRNRRLFDSSRLSQFHPSLNPAVLEADANRALILLVDILQSACAHQGSFLVGTINSLAAIAKNRPVYYERILPVLLGFDPSLEVAKGAHPASLRYSLKTAFLGFLRSPCQAMIESKDTLVRQLRVLSPGEATEQIIRQVEKMTRNIERASRASKDEPSTLDMPYGDISRKYPAARSSDAFATADGVAKRARFDTSAALNPPFQGASDYSNMQVDNEANVDHSSDPALLNCDMSPVEKMIEMIGALLAEGERGAESLGILISTVEADVMADIVIETMKHLPETSILLATSNNGQQKKIQSSSSPLTENLPANSHSLPYSTQFALPADGVSMSMSDVPVVSGVHDSKRDPRRDPRRLDPRRTVAPAATSSIHVKGETTGVHQTNNLSNDICVSQGNSQQTKDSDGDRVTQGLGTVWSLILARPPLRQDCLDIALKCAIHSQDEVRGKAVRLVTKKLYELTYASERVEQFAIDSLLAIANKHGVETDINSTSLKESSPEFEAGSQETSVSGSHISDAEPSENTCNKTDLVSPKQSAVSVSEAKRHTSLFFALCTKRPILLQHLFNVYGRSPKVVKQCIHWHIPNLVRNLGSSCSEMLAIIHNPPEGSEELVTLILQTLTEDSTPSAELVAAVKHLYETKLKDASILIPLLSSFPKEEVLPIFPRLVDLPPDRFQDALARILQGSAHTGPALTPAEVLIAIHDINPEKDRVALKKVTDACTACFEQRTVDNVPIPLLFMRTVIQALDAFPALVDFVMEILSRLVNKQIWKMPKLWVGFLKLAYQTQPRSFDVILQLPPPQLEIALNKYPNLRTPLCSFVNQRNMHSILPRQILKVLGFINEPHQAPIPFVPAAMQTADATSSLPGATLM
uniref:Symplekin C-terminal domain-containing protein n=1 Tax=Oryza meridionalis TaxID=40149 RepID=A0A0E0C6I1_9ORYZ